MNKYKGINWSNLKEITKMKLSISVVFSSVSGYLLAVDNFSWNICLLLIIGGYAMVAASNGFNQIIEKDLDKLMKRTCKRPLPSGKMTVNQVFIISVILTIIGLICLYMINQKTAFFSAISMFLYTSVYTPLKTKTPLSVFVGAIPGAIPFMLGWVAATNSFGIEPGILFLIQFFWQFPHFWAIAWILDEDYKKAGFKMLPMGRKDRKMVVQIMFYILFMIFFSIFPALGLSGTLHLTVISAVIIALFGFMMLYVAMMLYKKMDQQTAKKLMLRGVMYISLIQIIYVVDVWFLQ